MKKLKTKRFQLLHDCGEIVYIYAESIELAIARLKQNALFYNGNTPKFKDLKEAIV